MNNKLKVKDDRKEIHRHTKNKIKMTWLVWSVNNLSERQTYISSFHEKKDNKQNGIS